MQKSTKLEQGELLNTQLNVEENQSKENYGEQMNELVERHDIEGTPFKCIGNKEQGYFIALGKYRMSEVFSFPDEAEKYLKVNTWDVVMKMIVTHAEVTEQIREEMKEFNKGLEETNGDE